MKKLRIYVDTSVLGGCFDSEFDQWSNRLLEAFRRGEYIPVLSAVIALEVEHAPEPVNDVHAELIAAGAELLMVSAEALDLLGQYQAKKILGPKFQNDMLHIALATIANADLLVRLEFPPHCPTRQDSSLQCSQYRMWLQGFDDLLSERGCAR